MNPPGPALPYTYLLLSVHHLHCFQDMQAHEHCAMITVQSTLLSVSFTCSSMCTLVSEAVCCWPTAAVIPKLFTEGFQYLVEKLRLTPAFDMFESQFQSHLS